MLNWKLLGVLVLCLYARGELGIEIRSTILGNGDGQDEMRVTTKKEGDELDAQRWRRFCEFTKGKEFRKAYAALNKCFADWGVAHCVIQMCRAEIYVESGSHCRGGGQVPHGAKE